MVTSDLFAVSSFAFPECYTVVVDCVRSLSSVQFLVTQYTTARQASLSFTISQRLFKLMSIKSVMPSFLSCVTCFFSCPPSFPASGSFPMSGLSSSGGQSIGASATVLPINIQGWLPLGLTGLISLLSKELSSLLQHPVQKHQFFSSQPSLWSNSHICTWLLEKP